MIDINGSAGEGGGQVLRTALALALLTGKSFTLRNIRAKRRPKPGLRPQHLACVRAAAQIGNAAVQGDTVGSSHLIFVPGPVTPGNYRFAIGTAGSTALVLHTVYLPLALAGGPSEVTIEGGTHNDKAPSFDFLQVIWRNYMRQLGIDVALHLQRPGFYPRGGGCIEASIGAATALRPLQSVMAATWPRAQVIAATAGLPAHVAKRMARRAEVRLRDAGIEVDTRTEEWQNGPGCVLSISLHGDIPAHFHALGERGKPAEAVADEAVEQALAQRTSATPVDRYSADQLLLPLALAAGESAMHTSELTLHLQTNAEIVRHFVACEIALEGELGNAGIVRLRGCQV